MATESLLSELRQIYSSIIQGFALTSYRSEPLYIRHFSPLEQAEIDERYKFFYDQAQNKGLSTEDQQLQELKRLGEWGDKEELEIKKAKFDLSELVSIKKNLSLPSQLKKLNEDISVAENKITKILKVKSSLLTMTCESFATQKVNEVYIYKSLFKEKEFLTPFFSEEDYENLDRHEIYNLITMYNSKISEFSDLNIQRVACAAFFQDYFRLCDNNVFSFYGKAIVYLTYYQSTLARYGKFFDSILSSENRPPDDIVDNPEKLIDWVTTSNNAKKVAEQNTSTGEAGSISLIGATPEDIKALNLNTKVISFGDIAKKSGKTSLSMADMMAAQGITDKMAG